MFFFLEYQECIQLRCQFSESVLCWMHSTISVKPVSQQSIKRSNLNTAGLLGIDNKLTTKNLIPSEFAFFLFMYYCCALFLCFIAVQYPSKPFVLVLDFSALPWKP